MKPISGTTRLFGILADPVEHVRTPEVFNAWFAERGLDAVLVPLHVGAQDLAVQIGALRTLRNLGGVIVTVPHKAAVVPLCDELTEAARQVGAVNTIRRTVDGKLIGANFDGVGFVEGLRRTGNEPHGKRAFLAGAGGAANAIAFALCEAGVAALTVYNRTPAKAEELLQRLARAYPGTSLVLGSPDPAGHELAVNATSLGLRPGDPLPFDLEGSSPGTLVAEVIMKPVTTPLLAEAARRGLPVHHGRHMLDAQVELMATFLELGQR